MQHSSYSYTNVDPFFLSSYIIVDFLKVIAMSYVCEKGLYSFSLMICDMGKCLYICYILCAVYIKFRLRSLV